jgi:hypothetical protein
VLNSSRALSLIVDFAFDARGHTFSFDLHLGNRTGTSLLRFDGAPMDRISTPHDSQYSIHNSVYFDII